MVGRSIKFRAAAAAEVTVGTWLTEMGCHIIGLYTLCLGKNETKMLLWYLLRWNSDDSYKVWCIVYWINLLQNYVHFFTSPEERLYTTLWNLSLSCACYHWVVRKSNSKIYPTSSMTSKFAIFESILLQYTRILRENVYKTRITDLELSTTPLTNGCHNDHVILAHSVSVAVSVRPDEW